jgi:ParB family chromosome partitioning protein
MTDAPPDIQQIPIQSISILNPRVRNKRVFNELVASIECLGLKKPITVSRRPGADGYNLVCGQGRLEAYIALGQTEIPAVVLTASEEDCFVMSLVENLARRHHSPLELIREIGSLRDRGYTVTDIARKTGFSDDYVKAINYLLEHGEERLLAGIERGIIPASIAIEIARAQDGDLQAALTDAYEKRAIKGSQILAIRRIIEIRNNSGKALTSHGGLQPKAKKPITADSLVRSFRKETDRQKLLVKKAAVSQSRLLFLVNGLKRLMADDHFRTLLRAEGLHSLPRPLAERLDGGN